MWLWPGDPRGQWHVWRLKWSPRLGPLWGGAGSSQLSGRLLGEDNSEVILSKHSTWTNMELKGFLLVPRAIVTKLSGINNTFWRLKVSSQDVSRVSSFWWLRENPFHASLLASGGFCQSPNPLACRHITSISVSMFTGPSPLVSLTRICHWI